MNAVGIVCGPAQAGMDVLLLEIDSAGERELARLSAPYPEPLHAALAQLEAGQPPALPLITLHGELGRAMGAALRAVRKQAQGALAAVGARGYLLSSGALAGGDLPSGALLLGDLGLAGEAAPDEGRPPLLPVAAVTASAYDCARLAAAAAGASAAPAGDVPAGLAGLLTEGRNPRTLELDRLPTLEMLHRINAEDALVAPAVALELPRIAEAVDRAAARMADGGRIIYVGAGTSGRLGVLDASEIPPTYGLDPGRVVARIAGGLNAVAHAGEGNEDDAEAGAAAVVELGVSARDCVVGLAASGRTPYVLGALQAARKAGALTVSIACNHPSPLEALADVAIAPLVGPEAITGSTRMKAGTAQKLVLNMLSTGVMVRLGKTYSNLMVDMRANNVKLRARAERMVALASGHSQTAAAEALAASDGEVKTAIVALLAGVAVDEARRRLERSQGRVRAALEG